jgi:hypothetical protein
MTIDWRAFRETVIGAFAIGIGWAGGVLVVLAALIGLAVVVYRIGSHL